MSLLALPNELILLIASLLGPKHLNALIQTSRHLSFVLTSLLHRFAIQPHDGFPPFHWATIRGHKSLIKLLLEKKFDINARHDSPELGDGVSALHYAAHMGKLEIVKLLLSSGADINAIAAGCETPLHFAKKVQHERVTKLLEKNGGLDIKNNSRSRALERAVREGEEKIVRFLIEKGFDVNVTGSRQATPLHWAAMHGRTSIATLLLDKGAKVDAVSMNRGNSSGCTALHWALRRFRSEGVAKVLLERGADPNSRNNCGDTVLHVAARWGCEGQLALLLEKAELTTLNDSQQMPIELADWGGKVENVRMILMKGIELGFSEMNGIPILHFAAGNGLEDLTRAILSTGVDINIKCVKGSTALIRAATRGYDSVIKFLLGNGADASIRDNTGYGAFYYATRHGHEVAVRMLIKFADIQHDIYGAIPLLHTVASTGDAVIIEFILDTYPTIEVNYRNLAGQTILHLASGYYEKPKVIELLLKKGASPNIEDNDGNTPLHTAVANGHASTTKIFLENGADLKARNNNGETVLDIASKRETRHIEALLLSFVTLADAETNISIAV